MQEYFRVGIRQVWIVIPAAKTSLRLHIVDRGSHSQCFR